MERNTLPSDAPFDSSLAVAEVEKRQCNNQNIQGNDNAQVCGDDNTVESNSGSENVSNSHGLSRSDKIAIGVGVGGGVVAIIGVVLTYFQLRNRKRGVPKPTSGVSQLEPSHQSGSSWHRPQFSHHPFGRSELH